MRHICLLVVICSSFLISAYGDVTAAPVDETNNNEGYSIQTGYEGYLVPSEGTAASKRTDDQEDYAIPSLSSLASFTSSLFSSGDPLRTVAALLGGEIVDDTDRKGVVAAPKLKLHGAHGKPVFIPIPKFLSKHSKFPGKLTKFAPKKALLTKLISKGIILLVTLVSVFLFTGGIAAAICTFTPLCTISFAGSAARSADSSPSFLTELTEYVTDSIEKYQQLDNDA